jgi:Raf kinase inhibitor-like YbhB/YbcL family protein
VHRRGLLVAGAALALSACGGDPAPAPPAPSVAQTLTVSSAAFAEGGTIPAEYTCAGAGRRPPLSWSGDLGGAKALAVVVDDPDAPNGDFYHWVVVDLPAATTTLGDEVPAAAHQLENSAGNAGWTAPCPPSGTHHYRFTVYGLSAATGLNGDASPRDAFSAIEKAATAQGRLTGIVTHQG